MFFQLQLQLSNAFFQMRYVASRYFSSSCRINPHAFHTSFEARGARGELLVASSFTGSTSLACRYWSGYSDDRRGHRNGWIWGRRLSFGWGRGRIHVLFLPLTFSRRMLLLLLFWIHGVLVMRMGRSVIWWWACSLVRCTAWALIKPRWRGEGGWTLDLKRSSVKSRMKPNEIYMKWHEVIRKDMKYQVGGWRSRWDGWCLSIFFVIFFLWFFVRSRCVDKAETNRLSFGLGCVC